MQSTSTRQAQPFTADGQHRQRPGQMKPHSALRGTTRFTEELTDVGSVHLPRMPRRARLSPLFDRPLPGERGYPSHRFSFVLFSYSYTLEQHLRL